ncbi:MAG: radical SAM family heme chaperone HemW [Actinomycetota bacterium]
MELTPDSPQLADAAAGWVSAYVHIPFCARVCPYCDFAVVAGLDDLVERYVTAVDKEIRTSTDWRQLDSIYFGGGTPSRMEPRLLRRLLDALDQRFGIADNAEVSLEANPEDWSDELAAGLIEVGFNRVSFGAQSFGQRTLIGLGRRHRPDQVVSAVSSARNAGFGSVNLDLIFGTPGEELKGWKATLDQALSLVPDHISCYSLTVEPGTELFRSIAEGAQGPDADLQADQYDLACEVLASAGLIRYEVSNWAKPGHPVRYNMAVWAQADYVAFGMGAHGHRGGRRTRNRRQLEGYLAAVEAGRSPRAGSDEVVGWNAEVERIFLGIRRTAGVELGEAGELLLASGEGQRLEAARVIRREGDRLVVKEPLLTDAVARAVLALNTPRVLI